MTFARGSVCVAWADAAPSMPKTITNFIVNFIEETWISGLK
jgi:hypothetical protein